MLLKINANFDFFASHAILAVHNMDLDAYNKPLL
jgi:hypothetical protein